MKAVGVLNCARVQQRLDAFADGELRGPELLTVSRHLETCEACRADLAVVRRIGESLRGAALTRMASIEALAGLPDGVVSRVRAEAAQSWSAKMGRALDDCHWLLVGVGSFSAALLSVLLVCAMVQVGLPERDDSMAALLGGLSPSMDVVTAAGLTVPEGEGAVARATVTRYGRVTNLEVLSSWRMPQDDRGRDGESRDYRQKLGLWSDGPQETRTVLIMNMNTNVRCRVRSVLE
jgi:anti-sigma factor RsiW